MMTRILLVFGMTMSFVAVSHTNTALERKINRPNSSDNSIVTQVLPRAYNSFKNREKTFKPPVAPVIAQVADSTHTTNSHATVKNKQTKGTIPSSVIPALAHTPVHDEGAFDLTAYAVSPLSTGKFPGDPDFGITFSGRRAKVGRTVAVDPRIIPIGTYLYIEGVGIRVAEDTGGLIKGHRIDVLLPSDEAAFQFGVRRHVRVYALPDGPPSQEALAR